MTARSLGERLTLQRKRTFPESRVTRDESGPEGSSVVAGAGVETGLPFPGFRLSLLGLVADVVGVAAVAAVEAVVVRLCLG